MSPFLIFILVMIFGILPLSYFVYWYKYRGTIIYKTAFAILITNFIVAIASFGIGHFGIKYIYWYIPIGYLALLAGNLIFKKYVQKPVKSATEKLKLLVKGDLNFDVDKQFELYNDEAGQMNAALAQLISNLKDTAEFARQIGEGNLDHDIELLSNADHLRIALTEMRVKLQEAKKIQEEKRIEEEKRLWANEGLAKLNEILRKQNDVEELSYQIISFLVTYIKANQGGIFIRNNEEDKNITLDLKAFYAFNRRKYIKRSFELGEGLVGNCAIEKKRIHITEIPDNYIRITSGLGGSNPRSLILIPMKLEEEVLGVIEIASFNPYHKYQIEFLEQASLSIASSLNMAETNKRTSELLEKTQQQAEEMAAQEEEMRQNMEELQATQEESSRRAEDFEQQLIDLKEANEELERKLKKATAKLKASEKKNAN
ncbi:MAG: GAF domain-containing protein [Bacteroidales bacterium]|jgi:methyl-accepting chemotaxis protein|nr:GAF domain-containing protein [Bacteroidales bacterium]